MVFAQGVLGDFQSPEVKRIGLFISALRAIKTREVVQTGAEFEVVFARACPVIAMAWR